MPAYGTWSWQGQPYAVKMAGGNVFLEGSETAVWTGTFDGTSYDTFAMVFHRSGFVTGRLTVYFEGAVGGRSGTLVIEIVGMITETSEGGTWVIKSGTDGLAELRGEGEWWAPPWTTQAEYGGRIHWQ